MARNRCPTAGSLPNLVLRTLPHELAAVAPEVGFEVANAGHPGSPTFSFFGGRRLNGSRTV